MAKTKISEFSTTAGNNTDINSINIAEGCAPSGINDAIRELMRQLKEFQTGGAGDSVNSGGDFSVATNKFTVASASGNTAVAGTLGVTGAATLSSTLAVTGTTTLTGALVANGNATLGDGSGDTVTVKGTPTLEVNPTLSGGTANGVLYLNGSKVATSGSALTFDGTTLTVADDSNRSLQISQLGTFSMRLQNPSTDAGATINYNTKGFHTFSLDGSEQMRLTSTGLGIGTSSPGAKLDVLVSGATTTLDGYNVSNGTATGIFKVTGATYSYRGVGSNVLWVGGDGNPMYVGTSTAQPLLFGTAAYEYMRLDASGNLEIGGTFAQGRRLNVDSSADGYTVSLLQTGAYNSGKLAGTVYAGYYDGSSITDMASIRGGKENTTSGNYGGMLAFYTRSNGGSDTERARIDSSGNFGIGTSSPGVGGAKLQVSNAGSAAAFGVTGSSVQSTTAVLISKPDTTNTTSQVFVQFYNGDYTNGNGQINGNGASQAAFGSFSDQRLKNNIVDLPPQLSNIMALRPVEFDYIESEGGGHQTGFVAQEIETVFPDAVGSRFDGMKTVTGWNKTEAILVKAIQEQQSLIQQLTARVAQLESN